MTGRLNCGLIPTRRAPFCMVEAEGPHRATFLVSSWAEHLRQHDRVTEAERQLQADIPALNEDGSPTVRHHLAL